MAQIMQNPNSTGDILDVNSIQFQMSHVTTVSKIWAVSSNARDPHWFEIENFGTSVLIGFKNEVSKLTLFYIKMVCRHTKFTDSIIIGLEIGILRVPMALGTWLLRHFS